MHETQEVQNTDREAVSESVDVQLQCCGTCTKKCDRVRNRERTRRASTKKYAARHGIHGYYTWEQAMERMRELSASGSSTVTSYRSTLADTDPKVLMQHIEDEISDMDDFRMSSHDRDMVHYTKYFCGAIIWFSHRPTQVTDAEFRKNPLRKYSDIWARICAERDRSWYEVIYENAVKLLSRFGIPENKVINFKVLDDPNAVIQESNNCM